MRRLETVRFLEIVVTVSVVLIVLSELLLYVPPFHPSPSVETSFHFSGGSVLVDSTLRFPYDANATQTVLWEPNGLPAWHLYYFLDQSYPSYTGIDNWYGLVGHLTAIAQYRGISTTDTVLNATQLSTFLEEPPRPGDVLLMAAGMLPDTVAQPQHNLLSSWVREGGDLVWVGDLIGFDVGTAGQKQISNSNPPSDSGWNGTDYLLPCGCLVLSGGPQYTISTGTPHPIPRNIPSIFMASSPLAEALGLDFQYTIPRTLFNVSKLTPPMGFTLGNTWPGWTNIARYQLGNGTIVDFAGPLVHATPFSIWIYNLLMSGMVTETPWVVTSHSYTLPGSASVPIDLRVPIPSNVTASSTLCVLTLQTNYDMPFGQENCTSIPL
jgi:hypothetical protein